MSPSCVLREVGDADAHRPLGRAGVADPLVLGGVLQVLGVHGVSSAGWRSCAVCAAGYSSLGRAGRSGIGSGLARPRRSRPRRAPRRRPRPPTSSTSGMKPPSKSSAVARVCGSPIASMTYGGAHGLRRRPTSLAVGAPRRCRSGRPPGRWSLISIASAPASRSSSQAVEELVGAEACPACVDRDPDARARRPARCRRGSRASRPARARRCSAVSLALGVVAQRSRGCARARRSRPRARSVARVSELISAIRSACRAPVKSSSCVVGAHLDDGGEAEHGQQDPDDGLAARRPACGAPSSRRAARGPVGSGPAGRRRGPVAGAAGSGVEHVAADGGDVGEDPDAEHDDDAGRELAADAELVAEVDDQARR